MVPKVSPGGAIVENTFLAFGRRGGPATRIELFFEAHGTRCTSGMSACAEQSGLRKNRSKLLSFAPEEPFLLRLLLLNLFARGAAPSSAAPIAP